MSGDKNNPNNSINLDDDKAFEDHLAQQELVKPSEETVAMLKQLPEGGYPQNVTAIKSWRELPDYSNLSHPVTYLVYPETLFVSQEDGWVLMKLSETENISIHKIVKVIQDTDPMPPVTDFEDGQAILVSDRVHRFNACSHDWKYVKGSEELLKSKDSHSGHQPLRDFVNTLPLVRMPEPNPISLLKEQESITTGGEGGRDGRRREPNSPPISALIEDIEQSPPPTMAIKGGVKHQRDLPDSKDYAEGDLFLTSEEGIIGYIITKDSSGWVTVLEHPESREQLKEAKVDYDNLHFPNLDAGSKAKDKLKEHKALKAKLLRTRLYLILLFIGMFALGGWLGVQGYNWVLDQVETGRYNDERVCKAEYKNIVITGKRTFSYPYRTLFGYQLTEVEKVLETTVVDVRGDRMTIMGLNGNSWWEAKVGPGEKGIQMLKDASVYVFMTEKGNFPVSAKGFCAPPRNQPEAPTTEIKPLQ